MVFDELIAGDVASIETKPVKWTTLIRVRKVLEDITGASSLEAKTHELPSFEIEGSLYLSPGGTLAVAETVASRHPAPFLEWVDRDERECKTRSKYGREFRDSSVNERRGTSPGWEFEQYQQRDRPLHELLRAWCGDRAITLDERLAAAEVRLREAVVLLVPIGGKRAGWRSVLEHGADATEEGAMAAAAEFVAKHSRLQRRRLPDVDHLRSASRPRAAPEVRAGLEADRIKTGPKRHIPVSSSGRAE